MSQHRRMLVALVLGAGLGIAARHTLSESLLTSLVEHVAQPVGQIFLRLLFVLVIPLSFSALVVGISDLDLKHLGSLGKRTLLYTVGVSITSVIIGLTLVNLIGPGRGLGDELQKLSRQNLIEPQAASSLSDMSPSAILVNMVPKNAVEAAATGDMLAVIVFALLFGVALAVTKTESTELLRGSIKGIYDVCMTWIDAVIRYVAPLGVACLLFSMTSRIGASVLSHVAAYVGVVLLGLSLHNFGVYSLSVRFLGGMSPRTFFRGVRVAMLTAFATASSSATLPTAIRVAETELKLPSHVSRFVLTAGSAMNQNGTALFEGVTILFLAQVAGIELPLGKQLIVMLISVLAGIGTAGVPAGSIPVIAMILSMLEVPLEGLGLIMGVDRFLDMCRTTVNVTGDLAAAVYVSKGEESTADPAASTS